MAYHLDVVASLFNFVGGVLLALEAMRTRRAVKERRGSEILLDALKRRQEKQGQSKEETSIYDDTGRELRTRDAIEDWFAQRSAKFAWIGFIFLALGFTFDLISKIFPSSLSSS